jgi:hypothetical protein
MQILRKATNQAMTAGPFLDKSDGVTPKTSLTTGSTLNGRIICTGVGASFSPATFTHDANGQYLVAVASGDVPTAGRGRLSFSDPTTYVAVWEPFIVLEPAVYDWLFGTAAPATAAAVAAAILANPSHPLVTDASGYVTLASAGLDQVQVESGVNARQALSPILAASAGVLVGAGTGTIVIKGGNVATTRITANTDNSGNRTSVNLNLPA